MLTTKSRQKGKRADRLELLEPLQRRPSVPSFALVDSAGLAYDNQQERAEATRIRPRGVSTGPRSESDVEDVRNCGNCCDRGRLLPDGYTRLRSMRGYWSFTILRLAVLW